MPPRFAYAICMVMAAAAFWLSRRFLLFPRPRREMARGDQLRISLAGFVGGVVGAKLPFIWLFETPGTCQPFGWCQDGKTIVTGLAGGYLAVEAAKWLLGVRVKMGDTIALPLALSLAVGRWGCYFNGCCAGVASSCPWAVDFGDGIRRHPTQLYESLFHGVMAVILAVMNACSWLPLQRLKFYLIAYCLFRFATEWIRPASPWLGGLTFCQVAATALAAGLTIQWWYDQRREETAK